MCKWVSNDKLTKCELTNLEGSEFCLFHKPNKTKDEGMLFWRIINFNNFTPRLIELELESRNGSLDGERALEKTNEIEKVCDSNFTLEEKSKEGFSKYREMIRNLYYKLDYKFYGYIFPNIDVYEQQFKYIYNPFKTSKIHFKEVKFEGFMNFYSFNFIGETIFENCNFLKGVSFTNAVFNNNVKFKDSDIDTGSSVQGMEMFRDTQFLGRKVIFENVNGMIEFDSVFSENTELKLLNMHYPKDYGKASFGEKAYRMAKIQSNRIGDYNSAIEYYYLEKCYRGYQIIQTPYIWDKNKKWFDKIPFLTYLKTGKTYKKIFPKLLDLIFKYTMGYGEKPGNALKTTIILISLFALFYFYIGGIKDGVNGYDLYIGENLFSLKHWITIIKDFGDCLYFSTVTFTTVGYGDMTPKIGITKMIAAMEMIFGVTFMGAWTATLLRKITQ